MNRVNQVNSEEANSDYYKMKCDDLETENIELENKIDYLEMKIKMLVMGYLNKRLMSFLLSQNKENDCSICLEKLDSSLIILDCNHILHQKCYDELTESSDTLKCPVCRYPIIDLRTI